MARLASQAAERMQFVRTAGGRSPVHRQLWRLGHALLIMCAQPIDPTKMICDDAPCEGDEPARGDAVALTGTSAGSHGSRAPTGESEAGASQGRRAQLQ